MTHRFVFSATITLAILASVTTACGPNAAQQQQASTSYADKSQPTRPSPRHPVANTIQPSPSLTTVPISTTPLPTDLHFSPADISYLNSVDKATRDLAIQHRRDNLLALQRASKRTAGYTDSLKAWSISTAKPPKTH
jgi:hypothetical protein